MVLYTCVGSRHDLPGPVTFHPCAKAMNALDEAGLSYEHRVVGGLRVLPWTTKGASRDEIRRLSGQSLAPCLVLDDGEAIAGSGAIVAWAREQSSAAR